MNAAIKRTPLYAIAQGLGARFTDQQGWQLPAVYSDVEAEIAAAGQSVVLSDTTPNGKLMVEGAEAEAVLRANFDVSVLEVGMGALVGTDRVYRLRKDLFFVSTPPGGQDRVQKTLVGALDSIVTVTDLTHGRSEIRVVGPASQEFLSKVCGLDFRDSTFPDGATKQSSVAKTTQLVIRRDIRSLPAFSLIGGQSLGAYLWDVLVEAGQEWELVPIGWSAMDALEGHKGNT